MQRTLILDCNSQIGEQVRICGWVYLRRDHGKIVFLDVLDRSGLIQVVVSPQTEYTSVGAGFDSFEVENLPGLHSLHPQDVVCITGQVNKRPENLVNKNIPTGEIEISAESIEVFSKAAELPFDMGGKDLDLQLPTLFDFRSLTLRHPKVKAIFKVQETIAQTFREVLKKEGFTEIFVPTIVPTTTEGGAEVFPVEYFDHKAYLAQSPQFYKQILVGVYERVFTLAHAYRAEPSVTTRHLTEYVGLDVEVGFITSWEELIDLAEKVVTSIIRIIKTKHAEELKLFDVHVPKVLKKIPRIKLKQALEIVHQRTDIDHRHESDLAPEDEKEICKWALEEHGSELVFITHYPTKKRPFYTMPDPDDPEYTLSFDLIGEGTEWVTGSQRINSYEKLLEHVKKWGNQPENFSIYLQAFQYGMPPEGGFCMGLERITRDILNLANIREASLFPRDMERVDVRLKK